MSWHQKPWRRQFVTGGAVAVVALTVSGAAACSSDVAPPSAPPSTAARVTTPVRSATSVPTTTAAVTSATIPTTIPTAIPSTTSLAPKPTTTTPTPTTTRTTTSCAIPSSLLGTDLTVLPTSRKVVALTFDAGASNDGVASILRTLKAKGVPATFFLTGDFVDEFPSSARAMAQYPIGNHTYHHLDLTTLTDSRIRSEINTAESRIRAITGQDPRPYFRFPFGAVTAHTVSVVNSECYVPFRWTVDTLGWKGTSEGQSIDSVVRRVLDTLRPGQIVLMHVGAHPKDGSTLDADALPRLIDALRGRGYGFVSLAAVLSSAP